VAKKQWKKNCLTLSLVTLAGLSSTLYAVTPDDARGITTITPGALQDRLQTPMFEAPVAKGKKITVPLDQQKTPSQAGKIVFTLKSVSITGAQIYGPNELASFYDEYIGTDITLAQLYTIADEITEKLREDGYVISKAYIPPQHISSGTAEIRIIGGFIDKVDFKGEMKESDMRFLDAYGKKILASNPLQLKVLERYALLANDLPGIQSRIVLSPSDDEAGAANLTFFIEKKPYSGYATYNNRGTLYTGPQQVAAGGSLDDLIAGGKIGVHTSAATEFNELKYGQFYWNQYIGTDGLQFKFEVSETISNPQFDLSELEILGVTQVYAAGLTYPLIRNHTENWFTEFEIQGMNTRSITQFDDSLLYRDTIRSLAWGTTYNFSDKWLGSNSTQFKVTKGIPLLGYTHTNASETDEPSTRNKGSAVFTKFNMSVSRLQSLPKRFSGLFALKGQYSFDRLLSSQEFSFGGSQFGLGYDPSEILGDQGVAAKLEIRWDARTAVFSQLQYFASYDMGAVWHDSPLNVDEPGKESGSSVAFGARVGWTQYFNASITVARPLTLKIPENIAKDGSRRPWRGFFNLSARY